MSRNAIVANSVHRARVIQYASLYVIVSRANAGREALLHRMPLFAVTKFSRRVARSAILGSPTQVERTLTISAPSAAQQSSTSLKCDRARSLYRLELSPIRTSRHPPPKCFPSARLAGARSTCMSPQLKAVFPVLHRTYGSKLKKNAHQKAL